MNTDENEWIPAQKLLYSTNGPHRCYPSHTCASEDHLLDSANGLQSLSMYESQNQNENKEIR